MKFKTHKFLSMGMFILILVANSNSYIYNWDTIDPTEDSQFIEKLSSRTLFIDPRIQTAASQEITELSLVISTYEDSFSFVLEMLYSIDGISIIQDFPAFNQIVIQSRVNSISILEKMAGIKGIYLNTAQKIEIFSQKPPISSSTDLEEQKTDSIFGYNVSEFLRKNELSALTGLNDSQLQGKNTVVAMIDAGIDYLLEDMNYFEGTEGINENISDYMTDFQENFLGFNMLNQNISFNILGAVSMIPYEPLAYTDFRGTGTNFAGLIGGMGENISVHDDPLDLNSTTNINYTGIAPGCQLLNVKVLDSLGFTYYSFILSGLNWALERDADIAFIPWSFPGYADDPICQAVDRLNQEGVVVVTAAGDDGPAYTSVFSPAQAKTAIRVGAYDQYQEIIANFSSRGPTSDMRTAIDLSAPAFNIAGPSTSLAYDANNQSLTFFNSSKSSAAIVVGAIAILIGAFPSITPEMIKIALMKTATPLSSYANPNEEGFGLLNLVAAIQFIQRYYETDEFPDRVLTVNPYPGMITNIDMLEVKENLNLYNSSQDINLFAITGNQALMTALVCMNLTQLQGLGNGSVPDIHLPLNIFGFSYNTTYVSFLELDVEREMDVMFKTTDPSFYSRYSSVLSYQDEIFITVSIESWSYIYDTTIPDYNPGLPIDPDNPELPENITAWEDFDFSQINSTDYWTEQFGFNYTGRVPVFKFNFGFINYGNRNFDNLTLHSSFKSDLYLNEQGITDYNDMNSMPTDILDAGIDDIWEYNASNEMFLTHDQYTQGENATYEWTSILFNSTTHSLSGYEIGETTDIFNSLFTTIIPEYSNSISSKVNLNQTDMGFKAAWLIDDCLVPGESQIFSANYVVSKGSSLENSKFAAYESLRFIQNNVSELIIEDLAIIRTRSQRMISIDEKYNSELVVLNLGNTLLNSTEISFTSNFSSTEFEQEIFSKVFSIPQIAPHEIQRFSAKWVPIFVGIYEVSWRIGGYADLGSIIDDSPINNFQGRFAVVYDNSPLIPNLKDLILITPNIFPVAPFVILHPLDIAMTNLTIISPIKFQNFTTVIEGQFGSFLTLEILEKDAVSTYSKVDLQIMVPMAYQPDVIAINLHIVNKDVGFDSILPIQFQLEENHGRFIFDGIHSQIMPNFALDDSILGEFNIQLEGATIKGGLDFNKLLADRVETIYGNYYQFHEDLSNFAPKGMSMTQLISGLDLSDMVGGGFDLSALEGGEGGMNIEDSFALQQIFRGDNFFSSMGLMTTDFYSYDLIKFFDGIIMMDPEITFTKEENNAIKKYLELGGRIYLFTENNSKTDINATNSLLSIFNITVANQVNGTVTIPSDQWLNASIYPMNFLSQGLDPINLVDPLTFQIDTQNSSNFTIVQHNDYSLEIHSGLGILFVLGDGELFQEKNIQNDDNLVYINTIFEQTTQNRFLWEGGLTQNVVDRNQSTYLEFNQVTQNMTKYLEEDLLMIANGIDLNGNSIDFEIFGYSSPFVPMIQTNATGFFTEISSKQIEAEEIWVTVMIDSPTALAETFSFRLKVNQNISSALPPVQIYELKEYAYPKFLEIIFVGQLFLVIIITYSYTSKKWKIRQKYIPINDELQAKVKTNLSSLSRMFKMLKIGIDNEELDDLERIRHIVQNRDLIDTTIEDVYDLASELGEQ
ncbi:S8 family serine peptidase [Candidatus Lokiarchaeum ossiferum]|uniref:S8 family serine peptidase n=1 Tax=Candidatus Lokiarchaeum ossiferum TaxID=2951803 RepID=UPI00352D1C48